MSYREDHAWIDDNTGTELKISGVFDRPCLKDTDGSDDGIEGILVVGRNMLFSYLEHGICVFISTGVGTHSLKEVFLLIFGLVGLEILSDLRHCWPIIFLELLMRIQVVLGLVVGGLLFFRFLLFGLEVSSVGLVGMILRLRPVLAGFSFHFGWVNEYILDELKLYKAEG
jgi:hypothetical protein